MTASRQCSECGEPLTNKGPHAKTCSTACRAKRSRRIKRQKKEAGEANAASPGTKEISERVRQEQPDVLTKVMRDELAPVVRESLTEETLRAIQQLVGLAPRAVVAIEDDLASEDATIRQRAYTLLIKYTVGHPAVVSADEDKSGKEITVNFALPRPSKGEEGGLQLPAETDGIVEAEVVKTCDTCGKEKPESQFAAASTRCLDCYAKQQDRAKEFLTAHGD